MAASDDRRGKRPSRSRDDEAGDDARLRDDSDFEDEASDDDDGSYSSGNDAEDYRVEVADEGEQIQVDVELFNMESDDYFTVKHFLMSYLDGRSWLAADIARHLADEMSKYIGTTVRIDGGREPFGFLTVLNLHRTAHLPATREIVAFVLDKVGSAGQKQQLREILGGDRHMGLLLNERMVNVPGQIAPPLHLGFWEEIEEAADEEVKRSEARPYFDIDHYLLITSVFQQTEGDIESHRAKKKPGLDDTVIHYFKPEEEVYIRNAQFAYSYLLPKAKHGRWTIGGSVKERRVIALFNKSAIPKIIAELGELAQNPDLYAARAVPFDTTEPFVNPCDQ